MRIVRDEEGFSLIELAMAVLIIGVLVGIAIPSFIGNRNQARNTEAKSIVRSALPAVKAYLVDGRPAAGIAGAVTEYSPSVQVDATGLNGIAFLVSTDDAICFFHVADTGRTYGIRVPDPRTGEATTYANVAGLPATCPDAGNVAAAGFSQNGW